MSRDGGKGSLDDFNAIGKQVFGKRIAPTMESIESYINQSKFRDSASTEADFRPSVDIDARRNADHGRKLNSEIPDSILRNSSDITSLASRKINRSIRSLRNKRSRKRKTHNSGGSVDYDVHNQYYAGIGHSDLDVQTGRPPLMFQMNFVEWLWFQSGTGQRVTFMLVGILFCFVLMHLCFGVYLILSPEHYSSPYLCRTDGCNYLSKRLHEKMNKSVDPCNDFYAFVCGSSDITYNLSKEEDDDWNYGFDLGRVVYDFRYSKTLGFMLKKRRVKPVNLILEMYQACLDDRKRNKLGLQPFFKLLKTMGLYDFSTASPLEAKDVVNSMAKILSHSFHSSTIMQVIYYLDSDSDKLGAYVIPAITEPFLAGAVFRFGYKQYHDSIHSSYSLMKTELNLSDEEVDILAHDVTCLDLYFFRTPDDVNEDRRFNEIVEDEDNIGMKPCEVGEKFTGTNIKANFGKAPNGDFDFDLLMRIMFKESNPEWDQNSNKTPFGTDFEDVTKDLRTDRDFVARFTKEFSRSAPIRIMRYLQWRLFYRVAVQLSEEAIEKIINVERHLYLGTIPTCFHCLFTWLPYLSQYLFLQNSHSSDNAIIGEFGFILNKTTEVYNERANRGIIKRMEHTLNKKFTDRHKIIIDRILKTHLRAEVITPVENNHELETLRELYQNLEFGKEQHLENLQKMGLRIHQWKTTPKYKNTFYNISPRYRVSPLFDKSITTYNTIDNSYKIYLPMAVAESPFIHDGLEVSDIGGLGMEVAENFEKTFHSSLFYPLSQKHLHTQFEDFSNPVTDMEVDNAEKDILDYHDALKEQFTAQIAEYKMGNKEWIKIKYESAMSQILTIALHDQSRFQALSFVMNRFLQSNDNTISWVQKKSYLKGFKEYNLRQIFYMALVNRRCEKFGPKKIAHLAEYGPLPKSIGSNLALSNVDDFGETFKCPLGSRMNRKDKISFWDRGFKKRNSEGRTV